MRKLCSYPDCSSGSARDRRKDKAEGKKKTFFSFPKDPVRCKQWQNALQRDSPIEKNEVLCELHFLEEDIQRQYSVPICQGNTFTLNKGVIFLKHTAVPQICDKQILQRDVIMDTSVLKKQDMLVSTEQPINTLVLEEQPADQESLKDEPSSHLVNRKTPPWSLFDNIDQVELPPKWELKKMNDLAVIGMYRKTTSPIKRIIINKDSAYKVKIKQKEISLHDMPMNSPEDCYASLTLLEKMLLCDGKKGNERYSEQCKGFVNPESSATLRYGHHLCSDCRMAKRRRQRTSKASEKKSALLRIKNLIKQRKIHNLRRNHERVLTKLIQSQFQLDRLKQEMQNLRKKYSTKKEEVLENIIQELPEEQQETVRACFRAAAHPKKGVRYTNVWMYRCLLMHTQSRKLYNHLRSHNLLALPHVGTLKKYIRRTESTYGFNKCTFQCMKAKADQMEPVQRRELLLMDKMKLSEGFAFNRQICQFEAFLNLGKYTPEHQKNKPATMRLPSCFSRSKGSGFRLSLAF